MTYYLGIDIGATKTAALICDENGNFMGDGQGGPGNHESVGFDGMQKSLKEALNAALANAQLRIDQLEGAGFGIAGYDWHSQESKMKEVILNIGIKSPFKMVNDVVLGLLAGTSEGWGIAVVSGTGCNCRGWDREHKREGRVTGYGITMGEGAGGSELIFRTMQLIGYSWTKRLPPTALTSAFMELAGAKSPEDLIEGYTAHEYEIGAEAARTVFRVAEEGDAIANQLVRWAGNELGEMANAVIRQLNFEDIEFEIALIGSMFKSGEILIKPMRETVHAIAPKAKLIPTEARPVLGAALLGMEAGGLILSNEQRDNIKAVLAR
jgi:N-acetylglucosamine kinase-like BadF-type ATPase